jgi:oligoendopeptidase F
MSSLPFGTLPPYRPRRFLPPTLDLGNWDQIAPWFDRLETGATGCQTASELEGWLLDWSEISAALDEEGSKRHIASTCDTQDPETERAFMQFVEQIEPQIKARQFKLEESYLRHPLRPNLNKDRYLVFDRDTQVHVDLFRPENVPLETEETKLVQDYRKRSGALTVTYQGQEFTLVQMSRFLEEQNRSVRQEAWELVARRRLQEADAFDGLYDQLLELRSRIARNAGFTDYRSYAFRRLGRFDYSPADCVAFHQAVEEEVLPLVRELQAERRANLALTALRPWDLSVDPRSRPPLRPFDTVERMVGCAHHIFERLDQELAAGFRQIHELNLLDLANRKGKAPGGYQSTLAEARLPFIFMNAVGLQRDVETILHEAGHAFHALASRQDDLYAYRAAPIEFCEVASMSMELLASQFLEEFYSPEDARRARRTHLEGIVSVLAWIATVDAFQHWVYTHPGHTRAQRAEAWVALMERFGGDVDWHDWQSARANLWHRQLHIFVHPFYYIEYGIAQLGALQVWAHSKSDPRGVLRAFKGALQLGGSRALPDLFAAAGCQFEFDRKAVAPLAALLRRELAQSG